MRSLDIARVLAANCNMFAERHGHDISYDNTVYPLQFRVHVRAMINK